MRTVRASQWLQAEASSGPLWQAEASNGPLGAAAGFRLPRCLKDGATHQRVLAALIGPRRRASFLRGAPDEAGLAGSAPPRKSEDRPPSIRVGAPCVACEKGRKDAKKQPPTVMTGGRRPWVLSRTPAAMPPFVS
ncbi:hypothetical protein MTO96_049534 [Rhipicephalus appendiculatus]